MILANCSKLFFLSTEEEKYFARISKIMIDFYHQEKIKIIFIKKITNTNGIDVRYVVDKVTFAKVNGDFAILTGLLEYSGCLTSAVTLANPIDC